MSRVICEVCGTAYPEASNQCPICGSVRPADAQGVSYNDNAPASGRPYQQVKGGRFSKANVQKRNSSSQGGSFSKSAKQAPSAQKAPSNQRKKKKKANSNRGLVITILVLLLAIVAVIAYIIIRFIVIPSVPRDKETQPIVTEAPTELSDEMIEDIPLEIPCEDIYLDSYEINLEKAADFTFIVANLVPVDTTDVVTYESEKSSIAMVEDDGRVVAVSKGETMITITCGSVSTQCKVIVGPPKEKLVLDTNEIVLNNLGDTELIYSGKIPVDEIDWRSDDPEIATIDAGIVTAQGSGSTVVYGEHNGIIVNCAVLCDFEDPTEPTTAGLDGNGGVTSDAEPEADPTEAPQQTSKYTAPYRMVNLYGVNNSEATIKVGERFELCLKDSNDTIIEGVEWSVDGSACSVSDGYVKGVRSGNCTIVATFEGQTYKFKVIVI